LTCNRQQTHFISDDSHFSREKKDFDYRGRPRLTPFGRLTLTPQRLFLARKIILRKKEKFLTFVLLTCVFLTCHKQTNAFNFFRMTLPSVEGINLIFGIICLFIFIYSEHIQLAYTSKDPLFDDDTYECSYLLSPSHF